MTTSTSSVRGSRLKSFGVYGSSLYEAKRPSERLVLAEAFSPQALVPLRHVPPMQLIGIEPQLGRLAVTQLSSPHSSPSRTTYIAVYASLQQAQDTLRGVEGLNSWRAPERARVSYHCSYHCSYCSVGQVRYRRGVSPWSSPNQSTASSRHACDETIDRHPDDGHSGILDHGLTVRPLRVHRDEANQFRVSKGPS